MVSSMLIGRLGNSLFQIAASIGYARKYGYQWGVSTNIRESKVFDFFPNMPRCTDGSGFRYNEQEQGRRDWFDYHEIPNKGPNTFLVGFFQSLEYFRHCQEEVKKVFALPHISGYENHVAIHVRRTDYVEHSGSFPPVTPEYVAMAFQKVKHLTNKCLVFSDDIAWCKENLLHESDIQMEFTVTGDPRNPSLFASCGHHIIANSTWSWWWAYLGHNPDKIIISPSHNSWFGPEWDNHNPNKPKTLIPDNWIQIDFTR